MLFAHMPGRLPGRQARRVLLAHLDEAQDDVKELYERKRVAHEDYLYKVGEIEKKISFAEHDVVALEQAIDRHDAARDRRQKKAGDGNKNKLSGQQADKRADKVVKKKPAAAKK